MFPSVPPLYCGTRPHTARVIISDPMGLSPHSGPAVVYAVRYHAGQPALVLAHQSPWRRVEVPPSWVRPDPAAASNVIAFPCLREVHAWPPALFTDHQPNGAA